MKEDEIIRVLNLILQEIRDMRADMALTLAIKRSGVAKRKTDDYLKFEEWAEGKRRFETPDVTRRFRAVKHTALNWMGWFVEEHKNEGWRIQEEHGPYPRTALKKM